MRIIGLRSLNGQNFPHMEEAHGVLTVQSFLGKRREIPVIRKNNGINYGFYGWTVVRNDEPVSAMNFLDFVERYESWNDVPPTHSATENIKAYGKYSDSGWDIIVKLLTENRRVIIESYKMDCIRRR